MIARREPQLYIPDRATREVQRPWGRHYLVYMQCGLRAGVALEQSEQVEKVEYGGGRTRVDKVLPTVVY